MCNREFLLRELENIFNELKKPQALYCMRINPRFLIDNTISSETHLRLKSLVQGNKGGNQTNIVFDPAIPNLCYFIVDGPNNPKKYDISVTIDRYAAESIMIGANLYMPGFINNPYDFKEGDKVSLYSPGHVHVANGVTKINSNMIHKYKRGIAIQTFDNVYKIPNYRDSKLYADGVFSDHRFAPNLACWVLMSHYKEGDVILDACSAPGHKTCALSEIGFYKNKKYPTIVSVDRSAHRLNHLLKDIKRLRLDNIRVIDSKIGQLARKHPEYHAYFDLIMLDPPCSALGIRPKLEIEYSWTEYRNYFLLQRRLFKEIINLLKPKGFILYNTCTLTILENEALVSYAINKLGLDLISAWDSINSIFPDRFHEPKITLISTSERTTSYFGKELENGLPSTERFYTLVNSGDFSEDKFENIVDLEKNWNLNNKNAKKCVRFNLNKANTSGYFFALLRKK
ncbi:MAG: methyltransferase domain-containing protein [Candidatus Lokiarchaeota archaeon]|nr:methyltransferase domain-containing protein [Candidatus Lokiarchaeota archaeon]